MFCHSVRIKYNVKAHVKPHVKCMKICVNLNEDLHVKACVKPHVKCMWKYVWKGVTSFHTLFTYISLCKISHACEICVWNACEKCVKNVWKTCEKSVKKGHFSHVFPMVFHIHTPSSVRETTTVDSRSLQPSREIENFELSEARRTRNKKYFEFAGYSSYPGYRVIEGKITVIQWNRFWFELARGSS